MGWLESLVPADADALRALAGERRYAAGAVIFHQGDEPGGVLVLTSGRVKHVLIGSDGRELILGLAGPGELVGEVTALDGGPRAASVTAMDEVRALAIARAAFEQCVAGRPALAASLLKSLAARLRQADAQLLEFAAFDVTGRVARRLLELSEHHGVGAERGIEITLPITQDELAAWTASSREGVAKALALLRRLGWIETHRRRIVVLDPEALRGYAR